MLKALDSLSTVTVSTLDQSSADMVADLQRLDPILTQLAASGQALPDALQILFTFPFPDSVLGAIKGDYVNAFLVTNLSTPGTTVPAVAGISWPQGYAAGLSTPAGAGATPNQIGAPPMLLPSTSSAAPGIPTPTVTTSTPPVNPTGPPTSEGPPTSTSPPSPPPSSSPSAPSTSTPTPAPTPTPTTPQPNATQRGGGGS